MSKNDYVLIATTLREKIDLYRAADHIGMTGTHSAYLALEETAAALARVFEANDPSFDRDRFMVAAIGRTD